MAMRGEDGRGGRDVEREKLMEDGGSSAGVGGRKEEQRVS